MTSSIPGIAHKLAAASPSVRAEFRIHLGASVREALSRTEGAEELERLTRWARLSKDAALAVEAQGLARAFARFHEAASGAGAPHLQVEVSEPRTDAKHLRAVELDLARGRHRAIITVKSRGEVTLVGPFRKGKDEGPCRRIPFADADLEAPGDALAAGLGELLERFLDEAATP